MIGAPSPECVDGSLGPQPGLLGGYRIYGRPGARVHKYNRRTSCGEGWLEASETSDAAVYIPASGVYEVLLDSPTNLPCDFGQYGHYEQYADVDGLRIPPSGSIPQSWYNSTCAGVSTCTAAQTYCPL
jgi:hypothetical protein